jgi:hypothetical protein
MPYKYKLPNVLPAVALIPRDIAVDAGCLSVRPCITHLFRTEVYIYLGIVGTYTGLHRIASYYMTLQNITFLLRFTVSWELGIGSWELGIRN